MDAAASRISATNVPMFFSSWSARGERLGVGMSKDHAKGHPHLVSCQGLLVGDRIAGAISSGTGVREPFAGGGFRGRLTRSPDPLAAGGMAGG